MIDNTFIKNVVSSVLKNRHTAALDKNIMHPKREWFAAILIGLFFLVGAASWSYITYHQFSSVTVDEAGEELEAVVYKESLVDTALFDFATRKKGYEELKTKLLNRKSPVIQPPVVEDNEPTETSLDVTPDAETATDNNAPVDAMQFQ